MNTKSDWQSVNRELMAERRRELGEPPTVKVLQQYMNGALAPDDEERVREWLACNPELARGLTAPFPAEESQPGEPGYVSDAELDRRWTALRSRIDERHGGGRVLRFSRLIGLIAATIILSFGAVLWRAQTRIDGPRVVGAKETLSIASRQLSAGHSRGGTSHAVLRGVEKTVLLKVALTDDDASAYRLALDKEGVRLWETKEFVPLREDGSFLVMIPGEYLKPANYEIVVLPAVGEPVRFPFTVSAQ